MPDFPSGRALPAFSLVLVLVLALALPGCSPSETPSPADPVSRPIRVGGASGHELAARQFLHRGNGTEPETLDPHRATSVSAANVLRDLFEGLITEAPDGSLVPGAAESWSVSPDGRVYTFRLRPGGRWSNGDPVRASDFEYGLRRSADPATLSEYSQMLYPLENARKVVAGELPPERLGVEALDGHTLRLRLEAPTPYLLGLLTHASTYPVHRATVERYGAGFTRPGRLVGNGAYVLDQWVVQSHLRLTRNGHYWNDAATRIDQVWYHAVENAEAELNRYRAGELDLTASVPNRQMEWLRRNLPAELRIAPYLGSYVFGYNLSGPPFQGSRELRLALSMAVDRDVLTRRITGSGEIPAYGWVPPIPGYASQAPDWAGWTQAERDTEARRLYAAAGYGPEHPLRIRLLYNTDTNHRRLAVAVAAMWRQALGVVTELQNQEWQVFLQTRRSRLETQVFRYGWIGDYNDPYTFAEILRTGFGLNDMGYSNPRYDALLDRAAVEPDPVRRMGFLADAEALMLDDMPILPVYFYVSRHLAKPWVGGLQGNVMDRQYTRHLHILAH